MKKTYLYGLQQDSVTSGQLTKYTHNPSANITERKKLI